MSSSVTFDDVGPRGSQPPPQRIGRWQVEKSLGRGGMGIVYLAHDPETGVRAAVKMMLTALADDDSQLRFLREAESAGAVDHPRVVRLLEAGEHDGKPFIAFEFIPGGDLDAYLKQRGQLADKPALEFIRACADGLDALHAAGLVHRDIKPANVFLDADNQPKLGDLGLARHTSGEDRFTMTGQAMGTPPYMSPEHIRGEGDIDIRTDIYALGAMLYKLVTGLEPYRGETPYAVTHAVLSQPVPDPRNFNGMVTASVAAICARCMAKDADQRYATPKELIADLDAAIAKRQLVYATGGTPTMLVDEADAVTGPSPRGPSGSHTTGGAGRMPGWVNIAGQGPVLKLVAGGILVVLFTLVVIPALQVESGGSVTEEVTWAQRQGSDQHGPWAEVDVGSVSLLFRQIPAGRIAVDGLSYSQPQPFWILATEVTQAQWQAILRENPSPVLGADLPVHGISRDEADVFCAALSALLSYAQARLPTELEWEYACRGGVRSPWPGGTEQAQVGHIAPPAIEAIWGSQEDGYLALQAVQEVVRSQATDPRFAPQPVAQRMPNPWGLYDMLGNVAEWTATDWDGQAAIGSTVSGDYAVVRGGSWFAPREDSTPGQRLAIAPDGVGLTDELFYPDYDYRGFRIILSSTLPAVSAD